MRRGMFAIITAFFVVVAIIVALLVFFGLYTVIAQLNAAQGGQHGRLASAQAFKERLLTCGEKTMLTTTQLDDHTCGTTGKLYTGIHRALTGEHDLAYRQLPASSFPSEVYTVWSDCGFGMQDKDETVSVTGEGAVTLPFLFAAYKKLNLCTTVQSASQGCGNREDVRITNPPSLPAVIRVVCNSTTRQLVIT